MSNEEPKVTLTCSTEADYTPNSNDPGAQKTESSPQANLKFNEFRSKHRLIVLVPGKLRFNREHVQLECIAPRFPKKNTRFIVGGAHSNNNFSHFHPDHVQVSQVASTVHKPEIKKQMSHRHIGENHQKPTVKRDFTLKNLHLTHHPLQHHEEAQGSAHVSHQNAEHSPKTHTEAQNSQGHASHPQSSNQKSKSHLAPHQRKIKLLPLKREKHVEAIRQGRVMSLVGEDNQRNKRSAKNKSVNLESSSSIVHLFHSPQAKAL